MIAKKFFYVCAGLMCLAFAYHLGARSATAAPPAGNPVVAAGTNGLHGGSSYGWVVTASGDYFYFDGGNWRFHSNVFAGAPTPVGR